ncbi:cell wall protein Ecm33 [Collariella sp. IMI 366227]|nr:cell wall protein Ecm33 [Collariella sp. IMI 366227]
MFVNYLLPAFVAIGSAAAQAGTCTISGSATTVNSQADATNLAGCRTVKGSVVIGEQAGGIIDISGPREITGDLKVLNNGVLETFSSTSLTTIGGAFKLNNVTKLSDLQFASLTSVKSLEFTSVTNLNSMRLGPLNKADNVIISDTFLNTLEGINLTTVGKLDINNNRRLTKFATQLQSLSDTLVIQANGLKLEVSLPNLEWISEMAIANVTEFLVPSLKVVNGSARFDSNYFETFGAPNLTHTEKGDISFVGNAKLTNMTFPKLTDIGGGLLIANNTALDQITFFPKLKSIGGAIKLNGNFTEVDFPELDVVKGAFNVTSTADIKASCDKLNKLAPASQGGEGKVEGTFRCLSNKENANEDTSSDSSDGSSDGTDGNTDEDDKNSAAGMMINSALFGLVAVAALASAL